LSGGGAWVDVWMSGQTRRAWRTTSLNISAGIRSML
jgi:hypothetical protein